MTQAKALMIEHARPPLDRWFDHIFGDEGIFAERTLITVAEIEAEALNTNKLSKKVKSEFDTQAAAAQLKKYKWNKIRRVEKRGGTRIVVWGFRQPPLIDAASNQTVLNMWQAEVDKTNTKRTLGLFEE